MTVSATNSYDPFIPNGVVLGFPFTFRCDDVSWVSVLIDNVAVGGYTVLLNADQITNPGGTATFAVAPTGALLVVKRNTPLTQPTAYDPYGRFPANSHETALDRLTVAIQDFAEVASRTAQYPIGTDPADQIQEWPAYEADKMWAWHSTEPGVLVNVLNPAVAAAASAAAAAVSAAAALVSEGNADASEAAALASANAADVSEAAAAASAAAALASENAAAAAASESAFYIDSGAADAYVLTRGGGLQAPAAYTDGMQIAFIPANVNTGTSKSTVNVASLGVKDLRNNFGAGLPTAFLSTTNPIVFRYNSASGHFRASVPSSELPVILIRDRTLVTVANTGIETAIFSTTVPGTAMGPNKSLTLTLFGDHLNNSGAGRDFAVRVKFGGITIAIFDLITAIAGSATRRRWEMTSTIDNLTVASQMCRSYFTITGVPRANGADGSDISYGYPITAYYYDPAVNTAADVLLEVTVLHAIADPSLEARSISATVVIE